MFAGILTQTSAKSYLFVQQSQRSFARKPMIQFLGPRSKLDKSVGAFASAPGHGSAAATADETSHADKKALSAHCTLEFADFAADRWARIPFTDLEIETIN